MPNIQSAIKDLRKSRKRAAHNVRIKKHIKTLYKKVIALSKTENADAANQTYVSFQQAVDKATKIGVIHRNASNRKKSLLARRMTHVRASTEK